MIKLDIGTEPANFEQDVHQPGWNWLNNNPDKWWQENARPPDYWKHCKDALETAQHSLCAYAAMLDPTGGSVDHFYSWQQYPYLAYAWENFRFASTHFNSKKRSRDDALLDPCEVEEGWFEISLP